MKDKLNTNLGNIIYIYNVLKKYSDEEHILSVKDIIKYLKVRCLILVIYVHILI